MAAYSIEVGAMSNGSPETECSSRWAYWPSAKEPAI